MKVPQLSLGQARRELLWVVLISQCREQDPGLGQGSQEPAVPVWLILQGRAREDEALLCPCPARGSPSPRADPAAQLQRSHGTDPSPPWDLSTKGSLQQWGTLRQPRLSGAHGSPSTGCCLWELLLGSEDVMERRSSSAAEKHKSPLIHERQF